MFARRRLTIELSDQLEKADAEIRDVHAQLLAKGHISTLCTEDKEQLRKINAHYNWESDRRGGAVFKAAREQLLTQDTVLRQYLYSKAYSFAKKATDAIKTPGQEAVFLFYTPFGMSKLYKRQVFTPCLIDQTKQLLQSNPLVLFDNTHTIVVGQDYIFNVIDRFCVNAHPGKFEL